MISSLLLRQLPLLTVQRSVALVPEGTPVMVVVRKDAFVIVAVPPTRLHAPTPTVGAVAFIVKDPVLHCCISATPASAVLGLSWFVIITSSVLFGQLPLLIVHLRVALLPNGTPVTPLVSELMLVTLAVPPITLHVPVPVVAVFAAKVKFPLLHCGISMPAFATVGVA